MNFNAFILPAAIILAVGIAAIIVVSLLGKVDLLKLKVTDLDRGMERMRAEALKAGEKAHNDILQQMINRETLEERLSGMNKRIETSLSRAGEALRRLGVTPETGFANLDAIDVRSPQQRINDALDAGDLRGALWHVVEATKDEILAEVKSGESSRAQPVRGPHCHTVAADFVHYPHGDLSAETAKLLRITEPGRHAVVVNVAEAG